MPRTLSQYWEEAVIFHGHSCPGLTIGTRIAYDYLKKIGLDKRAQDEEIFAIIETDSCSVDAVQVILGCTAGKGNLWLQKRGKHVFTFFNRSLKTGLRYSWHGFAPKNFDLDAKINYILNAEADELYKVEQARYPLPPEAKIYASKECQKCGERTAEPYLRIKNGQIICLDCAGETFNFSQRIVL